MKNWKRMICLLLFAGMLVSCTNVSDEQVTQKTSKITETDITTQVSASDNSARDEMFSSPREKTPWTVTGTVDGIEYKVTFDNTEYVLGEEFTFHVEVTNVSGSAISVSRAYNLEACSTMSATFYLNGEEIKCGVFPHPYVYLTMTLTTDWLPGETWEQDGFFSTSILDMDAVEADVLECRLYAQSNLEPFCIDIPIRMDVPEDYVLLPYLESGKIDSDLYIRARAMTENESIVVCSKYANPLDAYFPDTSTEEIPQWHNEFSLYLNGYRYIRLTREQLITILENDYYGELTYMGMSIRNLFLAYPQAQI